MVGETRIIAFGSGDEGPSEPETGEGESLLLEDLADPEWVETAEPAETQRSFPVAMAVAVSAVLGWSGLFAWAHRGQWPAPQALSQWTALASDWAVPVLLICVVWLLAMRNSRKEAARFGDVSRALSQESTQLETRLVTVNRELSLAREFIAAQSRDFDALGRQASERLSEHADRLATLIHENGERVDALGTVSERALGNMEKLRGQLPVIANSAKDVTNNIAAAGRTAHTQLSDLIDGFKRLNEFGQASEQQVFSLRDMVDETIAEFTRQADKLGEISETRFAALAASGEEFRTRLDGEEVAALAAIRARASALGAELEETRQALDAQEEGSLTALRARLTAIRDEGGAIARALRDGETRALEGWQQSLARLEDDMGKTVAALEETEARAVQTLHERIEELGHAIASLEAQIAERSRGFAQELDVRRAAAESLESEAIERLSQTLDTLDAELTQRRARHEQQGKHLVAQSETVAARLGQFEERVSEIAAHGADAEARLAASLDTLTARLGDSRAALDGTGSEIERLTEAGVRLLELLQASTSQTAEHLPPALAANEDRLAAIAAQAEALVETVNAARERGEALAALIEGSDSGLKAMFGQFDDLHDTFDRRTQQQRETLATLHESLEQLGHEEDSVAAKAQGELSDALERLTTSARQAIAAIGADGAESVQKLADELGDASAAAIDKAMRERTAEASGQLEMAAIHAAGVSREAAIQLRDQLAKVNELVGNLERRVAHARARAEDQVDNDFSRRAALITEALNSNAIDIAKALSSDVGDTAWAAYLRGDRGIFTRRAVSLLDSSEAREIGNIYERDDDFREHVSRYIHDFEAILRQVLSTRDGHALGVTLLSSDMGKLYVALAQGIERLRD